MKACPAWWATPNPETAILGGELGDDFFFFFFCVLNSPENAHSQLYFLLRSLVYRRLRVQLAVWKRWNYSRPSSRKETRYEIRNQKSSSTSVTQKYNTNDVICRHTVLSQYGYLITTWNLPFSFYFEDPRQHINVRQSISKWTPSKSHPRPPQLTITRMLHVVPCSLCAAGKSVSFDAFVLCLRAQLLLTIDITNMKINRP